MKERPIIFSGPMVRALLAGTKTQTRRVYRARPVDNIAAEHGPVWSLPSPYGAPGDRLWVRETMDYSAEHANFYYAADRRGVGEYVYARLVARDWKPRTVPSIHMPRWASRITLEVTEVRVQRVQDISEEDARAEGVLPAGANPSHYKPARDLFRTLWNDINEDRAPWASNPWVWALTFKRVKP